MCVILDCDTRCQFVSYTTWIHDISFVFIHFCDTICPFVSHVIVIEYVSLCYTLGVSLFHATVTMYITYQFVMSVSRAEDASISSTL